MQLWNGYEDIAEEVQLKTSRHSLSGELGEEEKMDGGIETKFHVFSEIGRLLPTFFIFSLFSCLSFLSCSLSFLFFLFLSFLFSFLLYIFFLSCLRLEHFILTLY